MALAPNNSKAHRLLGGYLIASGHLKDAHRHLNEAIRLSPEIAGGYAIMGKLFWRMKQKKMLRNILTRRLPLILKISKCLKIMYEIILQREIYLKRVIMLRSFYE